LKAQELAISELMTARRKLYNLLGTCTLLVLLFGGMWYVRERFGLLFGLLLAFLAGDALLSRAYYRRTLRNDLAKSLAFRG